MKRVCGTIVAILCALLSTDDAQNRTISYAEFMYNLKERKISDAKIVLVTPGSLQTIQIDGHLSNGEYFETTFPADEAAINTLGNLGVVTPDAPQ